MEDNNLIVVVENGIVTEVFSPDANLTVTVVDKDSKKLGEQFITEFFWPETQFDDEKVAELLKEEYK